MANFRRGKAVYSHLEKAHKFDKVNGSKKRKMKSKKIKKSATGDQRPAKLFYVILCYTSRINININID